METEARNLYKPCNTVTEQKKTNPSVLLCSVSVLQGLYGILCFRLRRKCELSFIFFTVMLTTWSSAILVINRRTKIFDPTTILRTPVTNLIVPKSRTPVANLVVPKRRTPVTNLVVPSHSPVSNLVVQNVVQVSCLTEKRCLMSQWSPSQRKEGLKR